MQMEIGAVAAARPQSGSAHRCILFLLLFLSLPSVSVDATITSPLITLSLDAGATGTVDVSFTTATTIPVDGTIVVTFASTFYSTTVSGSTFASTPITNAVVTTSLPNAGATVAYTVAFTTDVTLRIGSVIMLQFPTLSNSKIVFAGASLTNRVNIDAASTTVQVASPYLRLTIAGQDVPAATAVSLTYSNIINPAAQPSGVFGVYTRHPTGAIFQGNSAVAGLTYVSTTLPSSATLTPASYFGGIVTSYTVQFAHAAYLPSGSRVQVTFPARFDISGATMTHLTNLPSVNTVLTLPGVNMAQVTLGNVAVVAGTGRQFTLDGIVNPGSSCGEYIVEYCTTTWETYTISITDSGGNLFEESTTVPGTPIVKKPLTYGRVRPVLKTPNTLTQATVTINTEAVIPIDGSIDVVFPADYSVNAASATASSLVGIPAASTAVIATGLEVSLTIAGASISPSSGLSITFSDITTPSIMAVGNFIVRTRDALGNIMEESLTIGGEGCTYVNDCNGHGTCTLLSKACICDSGWGAPTDVTTYRSPDCSTREYFACISDLSLAFQSLTSLFFMIYRRVSFRFLVERHSH
ncbi:hypothetical protein BBJ28_00006952 [Nothophytophthora sp. Chile5]|nr:hypothetical protein BBJ28_00006952 [Nothophytophthora sp. Chile5]